MNLSIEDASKLSGLTIEEVQELSEKNNKR